MQFLPKSLSARIVHKIAADYRYRVPLVVNSIGFLGILVILFGIGYFIQNGFSVLSIGSLMLGGVLILPRMVIARVLHNFQDIRYHIRDAIVLGVKWRGDERVLDVGVGSGLTLFGCARNLKSGQAIGIDIYQPHSGGGTAETFWKNAAQDGLTNKVDLRIADAREMPFADESFDVVVSTSAFHHMGGSEARQQATDEIIRVLKPGGRILIYDLLGVIQELERAMKQAGFINMRCDGTQSALIRGDKPL